MKAALYTRVSTRDGKQDAENQRLQLRQLTDSLGWQAVSEYEDHESGAKAQRNSFQAMMRDAAQRKFDLVLVWALDRFSREGTLQTLKPPSRRRQDPPPRRSDRVANGRWRDSPR